MNQTQPQRPINAAYKQLGEAFVKEYYTRFDTGNRPALAELYHPSAVMTFEGNELTGPEAIVQKLVSLPFKTIAHNTTTVDCQPTDDLGCTVLVIGQLKSDDDPPHSFVHNMVIKPLNNSYFIYNDTFRLMIHNF